MSLSPSVNWKSNSTEKWHTQGCENFLWNVEEKGQLVLELWEKYCPFMSKQGNFEEINLCREQWPAWCSWEKEGILSSRSFGRSSCALIEHILLPSKYNAWQGMLRMACVREQGWRWFGTLLVNRSSLFASTICQQDPFAVPHFSRGGLVLSADFWLDARHGWYLQVLGGGQ